MLTQKLNQIRIASAGGRYPLNIENDDDDDSLEQNRDGMEDDQANKKKKRKETVYSDFVFEAKLQALLKDLLAAREEDPTCRYP